MGLTGEGPKNGSERQGSLWGLGTFADGACERGAPGPTQVALLGLRQSLWIQYFANGEWRVADCGLRASHFC
jgi:hypothetical protein